MVRYMNTKLTIAIFAICVIVGKIALGSVTTNQTAFHFKTSSATHTESAWNWNGWQKVEWKEGYFRGRMGNKTNNTISSPPLNINADRLRYLELYLFNYGQEMQVYLYFFTDNSSPSTDKLIPITIPSIPSPLPKISASSLPFWQKITIDLGVCPTWRGTVKGIMLSFAPELADASLTLYGLEFVEKPNYLYNGNFLLTGENKLPIGWSIQLSENITTVNLDPNETESGRSELAFTASNDAPGRAAVSIDLNHIRNEHYYLLRLKYASTDDATCNGKIVYLNADGSLLAEFKAVPEKDKASLMVTFQAPESAYTGKIILDTNLPANSQVIIQEVQLDYLGSRSENWTASWIWLSEKTTPKQDAYFYKTFDIDKTTLKSAMLQAACDDSYQLFLNGQQVCTGAQWANAEVTEILPQLKDGKNIITIHGFNDSSEAGLLCEIRLTDHKGNIQLMTSNSSWKVISKEPTDWPLPQIQGEWKNARIIGTPPCSPWGNKPPFHTKVPPIVSEKSIDALKKLHKDKKYSIDTSLGYPRISAEGEILTPLIYSPSPWGDLESDGPVNNMSGFKNYRIGFEFGVAWQQDCFKVDLTVLEKRIEDLVRSNPDAKVIITFRISAPAWWLQKYPDDVCRFSDNSIDGHYVLPSTGSKRWRSHVKKYLEDFIKHTEAAWYADRIIAYMPTSHSGPEWILTTKLGNYPDYSPAMQVFFQDWLKKKYNTITSLRKAWKSDEVTFETVKIPSRESRNGEQFFLNPFTSQQIFDYNRCLSESVSDAMLEFQQYIRELNHGRCLNFAYYGYVLELPQLFPFPFLSGHYDLTRVLNSEYLNGAASPISYTYRPQGFVSGCTSTESSYAIHDKLWIQEADLRTNLESDSSAHKWAFTLEETIEQNVRAFAYALTRRLGIWYYDLDGGWFNNPLIENNFKTMQKIYDWAIKKPITWKSPIAVFFDEYSLDRTGLQYPNILRTNHIKYILGSFRQGLGRCGTPYDTYILDDIYRIDPKQYKCIILLNTWQKNEKLKNYLNENFSDDDHMIIWIYAPGYSGKELGVENMKYMTGLTFSKMEDVSLGYNLNRKHKLFAGAEFDGVEGGDSGIRPSISFYVVDPEIEILGTSIENGKTIFALRRDQGYSTIFMASPDNTGLIWRKLFESIGITPLIDRTDEVYYDGDFVGIHFIDGEGQRRIMLDRNVRAVWDVFSGQKICDGGQSFEIESEPGKTRLFFLGNSDESPF